MTGCYADRLRDEAGRDEAEIDALANVRETWEQMANLRDCPPALADYAREQLDKVSDQIGELQQRVDDRDDDIHFADPVRAL
jgi:cell division protein FtsB